MSIRSKIAKRLHNITGSTSTIFVINKFVEDYGKLLDLKIDQAAKTVEGSVLLHGEGSPIKLRIEYAMVTHGLSTSVMVRSAQSDKAWLSAVLAKFVVGKTWAIPEDKADLLHEFLG
jgi:hypothetical protein